MVQTLVTAFNERYPDIHVQTLQSGSADQAQRYQTEVDSGNVRVDVLNNDNAANFVGWVEDGLLLQYTSPEAENYEVKQEGYWTPLLGFASVLSWNTDQVTTAPTSWNDLLDPAYTGRIVMNDPRQAGEALTLYYALRNELGPEFWEAMGQQGVSFPGGTAQAAEAVVTGEALLGINVEYSVAGLIADGAPIDMTIPTEGTTVVASPLAIAAEAPNPELAKILIDWLLSEEAQSLMADQGRLSVRLGIPPPESLQSAGEIKVLPVDVDDLLDQTEELLAEFEQFFGL
jgi:iron(III) transport system substrate-binding protein